MLDTSIVLMAGMLVMCVSEFQPHSLYLGAFTAWAIFAALITDLFLLGPPRALDDRYLSAAVRGIEQRNQPQPAMSRTTCRAAATLLSSGCTLSVQ